MMLQLSGVSGLCLWLFLQTPDSLKSHSAGLGGGMFGVSGVYRVRARVLTIKD